MSFLVLPTLSLLSLLALSGAFLPLIAACDRLLGLRRQRSALDKSAVQIASLAFLSHMALALLLGADLVCNGIVSQAVQGIAGHLGSLGRMQAALWAGAALLCLLGRHARGHASLVCLVLSGLIALAASVLLYALLWLQLRGAPMDLPPDFTLQALISALSRSGELPLAALYLSAGLLTGLSGAQGLCLIWYVLRRKRDEFGRDYYTRMLTGHARQAALCGGLFLLPLTLALAALTPEIAPAALARLWPWTPWTDDAARAGAAGVMLLNAALACLPLAVICWHSLGRTALPLQKKYLIFPPLPLLWIYMLALHARLGL